MSAKVPMNKNPKISIMLTRLMFEYKKENTLYEAVVLLA